MIIVFVTKPEVDFLVQISSILLAFPEIEEQPFHHDLIRIHALASGVQRRWPSDEQKMPLLLQRERWQIVLDLLTEVAGAMQAKDISEGQRVPGIDYQAFYVKIREAIVRQENP